MTSRAYIETKKERFKEQIEMIKNKGVKAMKKWFGKPKNKE
jgi:hypothetical protein